MSLSKPLKVNNFINFQSENCFHKVFVPETNEYQKIDPHGKPDIGFHKYTLDNFQTIAAKVVDSGESVMVSAHTSPEKTAITEYAISTALKKGKKILFTAPTKALLNQKLSDFTKKFGIKVGIMTGDNSQDTNSPILIVTTEILRNMLIYKSGLLKDVLYVIYDECHFIGNETRDHVWEISIMLLPTNIAMFLLSATMVNNDHIANWIATTQGRNMHVVGTCMRPVPLKFMVFSVTNREAYIIKTGNNDVDEYRIHKTMAERNNMYTGKKELKSTVNYIVNKNAYPCIIYSPNKSKCETYANYLDSMNFLNDDESKLIDKLIRCVTNEVRNDHKCLEKLFEYQRFYEQGIFIYYSNLFLAIKEFTEVCIEEGLAKFICTTETLGTNLNLPVKTVVFTSLRKFDGVERRRFLVSEFLQMAERAGRRGKDSIGNVIAIPSIACHEDDFKNLVKSTSNEITSNFKLDYNMILLLDLYVTKATKFIQRSLKAYQKGNIKEEVAKIKGMRKILVAREFLDNEGSITKKGCILRRLRNIRHDIVLADVISNELLPSSDKYKLLDVLCFFITNKSKEKITSKIEEYPVHIECIKNIFKEIFVCEEYYRVQSKDASFTFRINDYASPLKSLVMGKSLENVASTYELYAPELLKVVKELLNLIKTIIKIDEMDNGVINLLIKINDSLNEMLKNDNSKLYY
uniref:Helicase ATP-binding domain-containing protein n=1 Tax=Parastrongyloides trichosuri TaxID=131310 RepID=A0A0N4ZJD7_PARTI